MKKIALTSLLAALAVSGAHAANTIDGNPLYMPKAGHFYSVTSLESHTKNATPWTLGEDFGYGISDKLAVEISTSATENDNFDYMSWNDIDLAVAFRALDKGAWKLDVIGAYGVDNVYPDHKPFMEKDADALGNGGTEYTWTAGVRGGYTTSKFTVAGKALFNYWNTESFNWNEDEGEQGVHALVLGLDAQFVIDNNWNLVATAEYTGLLDKEYRGNAGAKIENAGTWFGEFGVNYNIDATKFVGAYINGTMDDWKGEAGQPGAEKGWGFKDGFGFGVKFGIDF